MSDRQWRRGDWARLLLAYSLVWFALSLALVWVFRLYGRHFLYLDDGLYQHFAAYQYVCRWADALIHGRAGQLSWFDFTLGQGADVLTTLNSYDFTDPISWLTALLPMGTLARYTAMIFVKLYLIGPCFALLCRELGRRDWRHILVGMIACVFCGTSLFTFARHPNYVNWSYFFPLILAGGARFWRKGRGGLLVAAVCLNAVTSYYTFYMNAVLFAIATVVVALCDWREKRLTFGQAALRSVRTAGLCAAGVCLSMAVLMPTLHAYLGNARVTMDSGRDAGMWHYNWSFYSSLLTYYAFAPYLFAGNYTIVGFNAIIAPAALLLFMNRRSAPALRVGLILCAVGLCLPVFGRFMNGLGYATNRWSFAFTCLLCLAVVDAMPALLALERRNRLCLAALCGAYALLHLLRWGRVHGAKTLIVPLLFAAILAGPMLIDRLGRRRASFLLCAAILLNAGVHTIGLFLPGVGGYVAEFATANDLKTALEAPSSLAAANIDDGFHRVSHAEQEINTSSFTGARGLDLWWSLIPAEVLDYHTSFDLASIEESCKFHGLDRRAALLETASVGWFTKPAAQRELIPYGYVRDPEASTDDVEVYRNPCPLPIGYAYPGYMLRRDFEALDGLGRQQAVMQCAVLDAAPEGQRLVEPEISTLPLPAEFRWEGGAAYEDGVIQARTNGRLRVRTTLPADSEYYLVLRDAKVNDREVKNLYLRASAQDPLKDASGVGAIPGAGHKWPFQRKDLAINLGQAAPGPAEITVLFSEDTRLVCPKIEMVAVPMAPYTAQAKALQAAGLTDVRVGADRVSGSIQLDAPGIVQFSIPRSDGWKAWVDGVEAALLPSGELYMALPLTSANHELVLRYRTPWLREGAAVSLVTLAGLLAAGFVRRRRGTRTARM